MIRNWYSGASDFARYVTYNEGATGHIQANALANNDYTWQNILKFDKK